MEIMKKLDKLIDKKYIIIIYSEKLCQTKRGSNLLNTN